MKLHQLRYLAAVVHNGLNITTAARKLHTSQPGVSKQLKLLEDELGFPLFERDGRNLTRVTAAGQQVVDRALRILEEVQNIRRLSSDLKDDRSGSLSIGTTHTQARYVLPPIVQRFRSSYPDVDLHLHQGTSEQIAELAKLDRVDFAIATGTQELFPGMVLLPCYRWHRRVIVPREHPLAGETDLSLKSLARFPIVTYTFSFSGRSSLPAMFESAGLKLHVALTASDADVIKTYVRLGLGVGIIASMAIDPREDRDLVVLDAAHLFAPHVSWIGFRRGRLLRGYMYEFLRAFAPHLNRRLVDQAIRAGSGDELAALLADVELPTH
ncbi:MAG TPA: HTH-type transcriptional regulator CysB [Steroidobacteraceae bacterium]|nr:HTH-type transcriptional regulator CysB [Steroidobacteraceae bacterium]